MSAVHITLRAIDMASSPLKKVRGNLKSLTITAGALAAAFAGINVGQSFIEANSQLEQMKIRLQALLGSATAADQAFDWVKDFQKEAPVATIKDMTESFVQLLNAGIDPTEKGMKALIGAQAKYGLSAADVKGVTLALRQTNALSNAQRQELNQLAQRIPKVEQKIREELNLTSEEFRKQMQSREISSKRVSDAIVNILSDGADESIEVYSTTWEAGIARIKSAWFELMTGIGSAGVFDDLKDGLVSVTDFFTKNLEQVKTAAVGIWELFKANMKTVFPTDGIGGLGAGFSAAVEMLGVFMANVFDVGRMLAVLFNGIGAGIKKIINEALDLRARLESGFLTELGVKEEINKTIIAISDLDDRMAALRESGKDAEPSSMLGLVKGASMKEIKKEADELRASLKKLDELVSSKDNRFEIEFDFEDQMKGLVDGANTSKDALDELRRTMKNMGANMELDELFGEGNFRKAGKKIQEELRKGIDDNVNTSNGGDDSKANSASKTFAEGWNKALTEINAEFKSAYGDMAKVAETFTQGIVRGFDSAFETFFDNVFEGTLKVQDLVNDLLNTIQRQMSQMLAQNASNALLNFVGDMAKSYFTGPTVTPNTGGKGIPFIDSPVGPANVSSKANNSVQIINQTGVQMQVTQARSKADNSQTMMTVMLDQIQRNKGGSRDSLRGIMG
jgi:tape measure domain-containing protein